MAWLGYQLALHLGKGRKKLRDFIAPGSGLLPDEKDGGCSASGGQSWKQQKAIITAAISAADHQARLRQKRIERARAKRHRKKKPPRKRG